MAYRRHQDELRLRVQLVSDAHDGRGRAGVGEIAWRGVSLQVAFNFFRRSFFSNFIEERPSMLINHLIV
jgi:hypothetical protein